MDEENKNETPAEEQEQSEVTKKDKNPAEEVADTVAEPAEETAVTLEQLQAENTQHRAEILRGRLEAEVMAQAPTLDVAPNAMPYLLKLADLSGAVTDKGEVDKTAQDTLKVYDAVSNAMKKDTQHRMEELFQQISNGRENRFRGQKICVGSKLGSDENSI